jgi:hypothetical protein
MPNGVVSFSAERELPERALREVEKKINDWTKSNPTAKIITLAFNYTDKIGALSKDGPTVCTALVAYETP